MFYVATREGAFDYLMRHRNITTGLYNEKRLMEKPLPERNVDSEDEQCSIEQILIPENSNNEISSSSLNDSTNPLNTSSHSEIASCSSAEHSGINPDELSDRNITVQTANSSTGSELIDRRVSTSAANSVQVLLNDDEDANDITNNSIANISLHQDDSEDDSNGSVNQSDTTDLVLQMPSITAHQDEPIVASNSDVNRANRSGIETKPNYVPMYEVYKSNNQDIRNQLEEWIVDYEDDEIEITVSSKGYGAPLKTRADGLIKPEVADDFSGMIPYENSVSITF